jgi:polyhydroxyalkanoate synthase
MTRADAVGCSQRELVWRSGKTTLYRYGSIARPNGGAPLLITYALVNRPYMMDLQPDRSLIRGLLAQGVDVYLIDWGYPDGADRFTSLDDYVNRYLPACVEQVLTHHRIPSLNLLGVCQGGVLALCYAALHAAQVRNLVTMVTPVDFHTPGDLLSKWVRRIDIGAFVGDGNVSGDVLNQLFLALLPFRLTQQKYVHFLSERGAAGDPSQLENFMRVERWIFDSPDQAGAAFREFVSWLYQENRLAQGRLELGGQRIDLGSLSLPVLNLIGRRDHLVPPEASAALQRLIGSHDYTALEFDLGHIGMYISARAQREVPAAIAKWLAER